MKKDTLLDGLAYLVLIGLIGVVLWIIFRNYEARMVFIWVSLYVLCMWSVLRILYKLTK